MTTRITRKDNTLCKIQKQDDVIVVNCPWLLPVQLRQSSPQFPIDSGFQKQKITTDLIESAVKINGLELKAKKRVREAKIAQTM